MNGRAEEGSAPIELRKHKLFSFKKLSGASGLVTICLLPYSSQEVLAFGSFLTGA